MDESHSLLLLLADMTWPAFNASNEGLLWLKGTVGKRLATGRPGLTGKGDILLGLSTGGEVLPSPMNLKIGKDDGFFCKQHYIYLLLNSNTEQLDPTSKWLLVVVVVLRLD